MLTCKKKKEEEGKERRRGGGIIRKFENTQKGNISEFWKKVVGLLKKIKIKRESKFTMKAFGDLGRE